MNLEELRTRLTVNVPEAGQALGIGRDAAYRAAERGEIPTLRIGRTLRVPVPALLALLGYPLSDGGVPPMELGAVASADRQL